MSTMQFKVQHIAGLLPDIAKHGGVKIDCDMDLESMILVVANIREQVSDADWKWIVSQTE